MREALGAQATKVKSGAGGRAGWGRRGVIRCREGAPSLRVKLGHSAGRGAPGPRTSVPGEGPGPDAPVPGEGPAQEGPWCLLLSVHPSVCARPTAGVPATVLLFS